MTVIVAIVAAVGGGAVSAIFRWLTDRKVAATDNWSKLAESYSRQLADMAASYGALDERLQRIESELDAETRRSNAAVSYIRQLLRWIGEMMPGESPPSVPDALRSDV